MSYFDNKWDTVLDSYNNPDWFEDLVFNPVKNLLDHPLSRYGGTDAPTKFQDEYQLYFPEFDTGDWNKLDSLANVQKENLDDGLELLSEQQELNRSMVVDKYEDTKARKIEGAEQRLDHQTQKSDTDKELIRLKALQSVSQINNMIAQSGIQSGYHDKLRKIQEDNVKASTNQANWNKYLSAREIKDIESDLDQGLEKQLKIIDAQNDAAYNTKLQNIEHKKETIDQELVLDKINVYDEWKTGHIETLAIMPKDPWTYDTTIDEDMEDYMNQQFDVMAEDYECVTAKCADGSGGKLCNENEDGERVCSGDATTNMIYDMTVIALEANYKQAWKNMVDAGDIRTEAEYLETQGVSSWIELIEKDTADPTSDGEDISQIGRVVTNNPYAAEDGYAADENDEITASVYSIYTRRECTSYEQEDGETTCYGWKEVGQNVLEKNGAEWHASYYGVDDEYSQGSQSDLGHILNLIGESFYNLEGDYADANFTWGCLADGDPNYDDGAAFHLGSMCEFASNK